MNAVYTAMSPPDSALVGKDVVLLRMGECGPHPWPGCPRCGHPIAGAQRGAELAAFCS
jgi:hypothetical protein